MEAEPNETLSLADRAAIADVSIRFATGMDTQNRALLRACFADQVDADYSEATGQPPATLSGDAMTAAMLDLLSTPGLRTQHLITNHAITGEGDAATCVSYVVAQHFLPNEKGGEAFNAHGWYTDALTRTSAGWRIHKRHVTIRWTTGNPGILHLPD